MDMSGAAGTAGVTNGYGMQSGGFMDEETGRFLQEGGFLGKDCFGAASKQYADRLMEFINDEFRDHLYYMTLAKRSDKASAKKLFREMSADELRHAKRFAAAYFLITGKRYFPTKGSVEPVIVPPSYEQALRERYLAESRDAVKYRMFAASVTDPCLKRMAIAASDDEKEHAQDIMRLIEAM